VHSDTVKDPWYLPDLTWEEVGEALQRTDLALVPVGAIEQHGPHLPLGTDYFSAFDLARAAAPRVDGIVAPALFPGVSAHHLAFPGTLSLSQETFVAVLTEVAECLAHHGFRRILLVNGHGGNEVAMNYAAHLITKRTEATAMLFGIAQLRKVYLTENIDKLDIHAGVGETSSILASRPHLAKMDRARKPSLNLTNGQREYLAKVKEQPELLSYITADLPTTDELSDTGVISLLDPSDATVERGRSNREKFTEALVDFVELWSARVTADKMEGAMR
jgi:creatinine amidohydrolase